VVAAERPLSEQPVKGGDRIADLQLLRSGRREIGNCLLERFDDLHARDILEEIA